MRTIRMAAALVAVGVACTACTGGAEVAAAADAPSPMPAPIVHAVVTPTQTASPTPTVTKTTTVTLTSRAQAKAYLSAAFYRLAGRGGVSTSELDTFVKQLNREERNNPVVVRTKYKPSGSTETVTSGGVNPQFMAEEFVRGTDDYRAYQTIQYADAMRETLSGSGPSSGQVDDPMRVVVENRSQ